MNTTSEEHHERFPDYQPAMRMGTAADRRSFDCETHMLGELIPTGGGDDIPLIRETLIIGRKDSCDICLRYNNISSKHCQLELIDGYWKIRDLGSTNGIKVNNERCTSKWLMPGDVVRIAKHEFTMKYTPTGTMPPPDDEDPFAESLLEKAGLVQRRPEHRRPSGRRGDQA